VEESFTGKKEERNYLKQHNTYAMHNLFIFGNGMQNFEVHDNDFQFKMIGHAKF
jgi:hypothetical protein